MPLEHAMPVLREVCSAGRSAPHWAFRRWRPSSTTVTGWSWRSGRDGTAGATVTPELDGTEPVALGAAERLS
ncbi:hypothetical protein ACIP2Y_40710 [Streptomyces sviceus]|uniref:hypothetical protein n=1 Tax=Streptomyces sviceus TaxID=285530 RepID=UPI00382B6111